MYTDNDYSLYSRVIKSSNEHYSLDDEFNSILLRLNSLLDSPLTLSSRHKEISLAHKWNKLVELELQLQQ